MHSLRSFALSAFLAGALACSSSNQQNPGLAYLEEFGPTTVQDVFGGVFLATLDELDTALDAAAEDPATAPALAPAHEGQVKTLEIDTSNSGNKAIALKGTLTVDAHEDATQIGAVLTVAYAALEVTSGSNSFTLDGDADVSGEIEISETAGANGSVTWIGSVTIDGNEILFDLTVTLTGDTLSFEGSIGGEPISFSVTDSDDDDDDDDDSETSAPATAVVELDVVYNNMASTTTPTWAINTEGDVSGITIYKGDAADFAVTGAEEVATLSDASATNHAINYTSKPTAYTYYRVAAVVDGEQYVSPAVEVRGLHLLLHVFGDGGTNAVDLGGVAIDSQGRYWIDFSDSDYSGSVIDRDHVIVFDKDFNYVMAITFPEAIVDIYGIDQGPDGRMYISGFASNKIYVVTVAGAIAATITQNVHGPGNLHFDASGNLWVPNWGSDGILDAAILKFSPTLVYQQTIKLSFADADTDVVDILGSPWSLESAENPNHLVYQACGRKPAIGLITLAGEHVTHTTTEPITDTCGVDRASDGRYFVANYWATLDSTSPDGGYINVYDKNLVLIDRFKLPDTSVSGDKTDAANVRVLPDGRLLVGDWHWRQAYLLGR